MRKILIGFCESKVGRMRKILTWFLLALIIGALSTGAFLFGRSSGSQEAAPINYKAGYQSGQRVGLKQGYTNGYQSGQQVGETQGYTNGESVGEVTGENNNEQKIMNNLTNFSCERTSSGYVYFKMYQDTSGQYQWTCLVSTY